MRLKLVGKAFNNDEISLSIIAKGFFEIYDNYNDYRATFKTNKVKEVIEYLERCRDIMNERGWLEIGTGKRGDIEYDGNYVKLKRIPYIIEVLKSNIVPKHKTRRQLEKLTTKTILESYALVATLLGDNTKKERRNDRC